MNRGCDPHVTQATPASDERPVPLPDSSGTGVRTARSAAAPKLTEKLPVRLGMMRVCKY